MMQSALRHLRQLMDERDRRYEERFTAQITLVNTALLAAEKAVNTAMVAAEKAVIKAETAMEKRFESVNEFRAALTDQAQNNVSRHEFHARAEASEKEIGALRNAIAALSQGNVSRPEFQSRSEATDKELGGLAERMTRMEGKSTGMSAGWGYLLGALGALATLATLVTLLFKLRA